MLTSNAFTTSLFFLCAGSEQEYQMRTFCEQGAASNEHRNAEMHSAYLTLSLFRLG